MREEDWRDRRNRLRLLCALLAEPDALAFFDKRHVKVGVREDRSGPPAAA